MPDRGDGAALLGRGRAHERAEAHADAADPLTQRLGAGHMRSDVGTPGERGRVSRYRPIRRPVMPTIIRTRPAVWTLMPATCAVTAYLRIAPTAIRNRLVPIVIRLALGRRSGA